MALREQLTAQQQSISTLEAEKGKLQRTVSHLSTHLKAQCDYSKQLDAEASVKVDSVLRSELDAQVALCDSERRRADTAEGTLRQQHDLQLILKQKQLHTQAQLEMSRRQLALATEERVHTSALEVLREAEQAMSRALASGDAVAIAAADWNLAAAAANLPAGALCDFEASEIHRDATKLLE